MKIYNLDIVIDKDEGRFITIYNFKKIQDFFKNYNIYKKLKENSSVSSPDYNDELLIAHKQKNISEMINELEFISQNIDQKMFLIGRLIPIKEENINLDFESYKNAQILFIKELYKKKISFQKENKDCKELNYSTTFTSLCDNLIDKDIQEINDEIKKINDEIKIFKDTLQEVKQKHKEKKRLFEQQLQFNTINLQLNNEEEVKESFKDN